MSSKLLMIISTFTDTLVTGFGIPIRHIVEGTFAYLGIILLLLQQLSL